MSGTGLAYAAMLYSVLARCMVLGSCYAMSGADLAYGAARSLRIVEPAFLTLRGAQVRMVLRACYVLAGTDYAYGATSQYRSPISTTRLVSRWYRMWISATRYAISLRSCYVMLRIDIAA
eukprot:3937162-Rhodomonas_salina.3